MRLLIVQYAGSYRDAFYRFLKGEGGETYYAQKYSVDAVAELKQYATEVATLTYVTDYPYDELLPNGVRAIGAGIKGKLVPDKIIKLIESYNPDRLILRTPTPEVISWATKRKIPTLLTLADSFQSDNLLDRVRNFQLANLLNKSCISWVGNHGLGASRSLQKIGVNPKKIIPWDWPHLLSPLLFSPKTLQAPDEASKPSWSLLFVGFISEQKGVGDVLRAIATLNAKSIPITLNLVGGGEIEHFKAESKKLGVEDQVTFQGLVNNKEIINLMRAADLVLIPSRHDYPEGFPMTIYEALCSRTPIIASDHPMFLEKLKHRESALIFPAGNPSAIARCIENALSDPELYESLSEASYATWQKLQIPVQWADLLNHWLQQSPDSHQWLLERSLASGIYH